MYLTCSIITNFYARQFIDSIGGETATLVVGPEEERIAVDKALLCKGAEFFRAAFNSGFKEGSTLVMKMPEEEPRLVKLVVIWLYAGASNFGFPVKSPLPLEDILKLYVLAEKWILKDLQRGVYNEIEARTKNLKNPEQCRELWSRIEDSSVRFLVIQQYCKLLDDALDEKLGKILSNGSRGISETAKLISTTNTLYQQTNGNAQFRRDVAFFRSVLQKLGQWNLRLPNNFEAYLEAWKE